MPFNYIFCFSYSNNFNSYNFFNLKKKMIIILPMTYYIGNFVNYKYSLK